MPTAPKLDRLNRHLLGLLQQDARLPLAELGRRIGLSTPAVAERLKRLEEEGVLRGYHAELDAHAIGYPVTAFVQLFIAPETYSQVETLIAGLPAVREAHHLTGDAAFILKVVASSLAELESLIARFTPFGRTETAVVLSTRLAPRPLPIGPD
ncbi:Lrp/AsnC family transcriptional regulator [Chitinimonas arctica]|nr:Lrp/AsnC family transcriptional regulator [Chitinimonas arctica]